MKRAFCLLSFIVLTSCGTQPSPQDNSNANTNTEVLSMANNNSNSSDLLGLLSGNTNTQSANTNSTMSTNSNDQGIFSGTMGDKKAMEDKLTAARALKEEIIKLDPAAQKQVILDKIAQAKQITGELKASDAYFIDADSLEQEFMAIENRMANTVQASALPVLVDLQTKFPKAQLQSLTKKGDALYGITESGVVGPLDGPADQMKEQAFSEGSMGNRGTYSLKYRDLFLSSIPGGVLKYTDKGLVSQKVDGGVWYPARAIETYGKSIYILDALQGKLLRYDQKNDGVFEKPVQALEHTDLANGKVQSFTIDGNIYVLLEGGKLFKFIKGEKKDLTVDMDLSKLSTHAEISTSVNSGNLYIFDAQNKKLYKLRKLLTGLSVAKEYGLPQEFSGFTIANNEKKAYFYMGSQVFTLAL